MTTKPAVPTRSDELSPPEARHRSWKDRARAWSWSIVARAPIPCKAHATVYRLTAGLVGSRLPVLGTRVLLLTTRGRRSGKRRTTPVVYFREGVRLVIVASNRGNARYPAWYWNLQFEPDATVQIGRKRLGVVAREARTDERRSIWPRVAEELPVVDLYQRRTPREIPVMILHPLPKEPPPRSG